MGIGILEIIDFDPQKGQRTGFGLCRRKNKISPKINLKLVLGNVFDLQNEFRYNRTRLKIIRDLCLAIFGVVQLPTPKISPRSVRLS
jgi:hypothetical protein